MLQTHADTLCRTVHHLGSKSLWHAACRRNAEGQIQQRLTGKK
ncbi:MAG: hypothetical protein H6R46_745, partial [Proteobacteria bacterium]|nr:hypothetical protein [Pseudomonadota bacterium]